MREFSRPEPESGNCILVRIAFGHEISVDILDAEADDNQVKISIKEGAPLNFFLCYCNIYKR